MTRMLLAVGDVALATRARAIAQETGRTEVAGTATDSDQVQAALSRGGLDAVLVHEDMGPIPPLQLIRELSAQNPTVGFLLLAREVTPELLRAALRAGARDVVALPLTVESLGEAVEAAASWSSALRDRMDDEGLEKVAERIGGRVLVIAGAKGGVGTTTLAAHLAVAAARQDPDRPVCLAELDLQAGDVRAILDVSSRRSVADLVAVGADVTTRSLDDTLYVHPTGLRVLLAPEQGEDGEDLTAEGMRRILGALKFQYDLVVCDVGATIDDATAVAVELADDVLVVATPDVPALRGANRLLTLWSRLQIRTTGVRVVLNRTHRETEIQPDFAERVVNAPLVGASVPSGFRHLEAAANTGDLTRLEDSGMVKAFAALAEELGVVQRAERRRRLSLRSRAAQAGQVSVEMVGMTFLVALVVIGVVQMAIVGYSQMLAANSARNASRGLAVHEDARDIRERAEQALPGPWRDHLVVHREDHGVQVSLRVPMLIPLVADDVRVSDRERTVVEGDGLPRDYGGAGAGDDDAGDDDDQVATTPGEPPQ